MKNLYTLIFIGFSLFSFGQGADLVIYTNEADPFFVMMNGSYQNETPSRNVRVQGLKDEWYDCKIIDPDGEYEIVKNVMVKPGMTVTYRIIEKKGEYKLRYYSESALETNYQPQPNESVISFHMGVVEMPSYSTQTITTTSTTSSNTQTTNSELSTNESIDVNIQVSDNGMSTNMTVTENGQPVTQSNTTITHTETVTTTLSTIHNDVNYEENNYYDCMLDDAGFNRLKSAVENESFADDQLRVANQAARNKCLTVAQVKEIAQLFSFSDEKLEFCKAAYTNCTDRSSYYEVLEVFTFSDDKEELENYMNSH